MKTIKSVKLFLFVLVALFVVIGTPSASASSDRWDDDDKVFNLILNNDGKESSIKIESFEDGRDVVITTKGNDLEITNETLTDLATISKDAMYLGVVLLKSGIWFGLLVGLIALAIFVFWLSMLVHSITNPNRNKVVWIIVNVIFGALGALVYYLAVRQKMKA